MQQKQDQGIARLKLALWYTVNFRPIMSHRFLEFILSTLGFVGLPPSKPITASTMAWREYVYPAGGRWRRRLREGQQPPRPKLPYPMIDGLHISTYKAFIDAVEFYLGRDISDIFHVRGMPFGSADVHMEWCNMEDDEEGCFYYRIGTVDLASLALYNLDKESNEDEDISRLKVSPYGERPNKDGPEQCNLIPLANINAVFLRQRKDFGWSMSLDAADQNFE